MSGGYWFPAKRHGFGWGLPVRWQGWAVLILYVALLASGAWLVPPRTPVEAYAYVGALTAAVLLVVWLKGEPLQWRWGGE